MKLKKYHQLNIRIYFEDTDSGGIVYHSKYLNFAERARTELLRKINLDQSIIEKKYGLIFVVKKLSIHYISTASLDDSLVVKTKILELNKAKVIFSQLIYKNKILISKLEVTVCCLNKNRKITRMNNQIYDILNEKENYMNNEIALADNIDISIWGLVLQADLVVRIVMLLLLMLSIFSWAIIFEKITKIKSLNKLASNFENTFWSGIKIDKIKEDIGINPSHPMEAIFLAGVKEWELNNKNKSSNLLDIQVLEQRLERTMASSLSKEMEVLEKNTNFLATTGSAAPFIGLLVQFGE